MVVLAVVSDPFIMPKFAHFQDLPLDVQRNYEMFWSRRQGHEFRITSGPFVGMVGHLEQINYEHGQLAVPSVEHRIQHIRVRYEALEEMCCQQEQPHDPT